MKKIKEIENYEKAVVELSEFFVNKYFGINNEHYFVGDCVGDVMFINDYFFSLDDMVNFLRYKYSEKDVFDYYDYRLDIDTKGKETAINIKNWKKLKKINI
jgi:hypothetical protein